MDERDFAELISVFLKGNEPDKNATPKNESQTASETEASEAEVRKNIIEALAERIKESQEHTLAGADASEREGTLDEESLHGEGGDIPLAQGPEAEQDARQEIAPDGSTGGPEGSREEPGQAEEEQLITKEEVDRLLNKEEPGEIVTLQQILHRFTALDGVIAALLVTRDGFIVDYASNIEFDLDMVSAVIATGFGMLDTIGDELERGALQVAMLEYEQGTVVISPLVHDIALVVVASPWTTLGRIRWEIKKHGDELVANL